MLLLEGIDFVTISIVFVLMVLACICGFVCFLSFVKSEGKNESSPMNTIFAFMALVFAGIAIAIFSNTVPGNHLSDIGVVVTTEKDSFTISYNDISQLTTNPSELVDEARDEIDIIDLGNGKDNCLFVLCKPSCPLPSSLKRSNVNEILTCVKIPFNNNQYNPANEYLAKHGHGLQIR